MKSTSARLPMQIATHSLAMAIVTDPWFVVLSTDLFTIVSGSELDNSFVGSSAQSTLSLLSTVFFVIFLVAAGIWLVTRRRD